MATLESESAPVPCSKRNPEEFEEEKLPPAREEVEG
jgi:hypothetical protein